MDSITKEINIYIIHKDSPSELDIPSKILDHKNLKKIEVFEFADKEHQFPKLENSHVSEATYYRLFIQNYLPNGIRDIVYLDADTIIIKDPTSVFTKIFQELNSSKVLLSARTEVDKNNIEEYEKRIDMHQIWPFSRLEIERLYFNAGVLLINYEFWNEQSVGEKLIEKMYELNNNIVAWDQDVLNSHINGNYIELPIYLNRYDTEINNYDIDATIVHYKGSKKPWSTSGIFKFSSRFYHDNYRKLYKENYHILHKWKLNSLKEFCKNLISLKFLTLKYPLKFIFEFIKSIIKV